MEPIGKLRVTLRTNRTYGEYKDLLTLNADGIDNWGALQYALSTLTDDERQQSEDHLNKC